jgi:hypothetical protein
MNQKVWNIVIVVLLAAVLLGTTFLVFASLSGVEEQAVARSYQTLVYMTDGGDKQVVASGGEIEVQSGGTLDVQAGAIFGGGTMSATALTVAEGITTTAGPLQVTAGGVNVDAGGVTVGADGITVTGGITVSDIGVHVLAGGVDIDAGGANVDAGGLTVGAGGITATGGITISSIGVQVTGGNSDFAGTLQYGADNLYPLGYATVAQQMACGVVSFSNVVTVHVTALTTASYVLASQFTPILTTAASLAAKTVATDTIELRSYEFDFSPGTTSITATYCAVGDE